MSQQKPKRTARPRALASNKRARREYDIVETFEAGISLLGTEVKSIRDGRIQIQDGYVEVVDGEAFLVGVHIAPYTHGNRENHDPERRRKLLLHRREIDRIYGRTQARGLTAIPLEVYLDGSLIKVKVALAVGKKLHDRRQAERERELDREAAESLGRARKGRI